MATGDIKNNLKKLQTASKALKYQSDLDIESLSKGTPTAYLPIFHHALLQYSPFVAEKITDINIDLFGKNDSRFIELLYKICRDLLNYKPPITREQFLNHGFAEKKIIMCYEVLLVVKDFHKELSIQRPGFKANTSCNTSNVSGSFSVPKVGSRVNSAPSKSTSQYAAKDSKDQRQKKPNTGKPVAGIHQNAEAAATVKPVLERYGGPDGRVEVITMNTHPIDLTEASHGRPKRPIDMVPKTPVHSAVPGAGAPAGAPEVPGGLAQLCKILHELTDKTFSLERRVSEQEEKLQTLTEQVAQQSQASPQVAAPVVTLTQMNAVLARLELLENSVTMLRHKVGLTGQLATPTATQSPPKLSNSVNGIGGERVKHEIAAEFSPITQEEGSIAPAASTPKSMPTIQDEQLRKIQDMIEDTTSMLALERNYPRHDDETEPLTLHDDPETSASQL